MKFYKLISIVICIIISHGCTPDVAEWTAAESPKKNKVDRVVLTYNISYPAHAASFNALEKKKLHQFLNDSVQRPSAVSATIAEYGGTSEKRIKDIKRELLRFGISEDLISETFDADTSYANGSPGALQSGVEIIIEKYIVIPPSCANFSQKIGDAKQSAKSSNFGCSVEANLGLTVANPRDLLRGRSHDPYDGLVLAEGVHRYRTGSIKALIDTSTTTQTSASAAAPSQGPTTGAQ